MYCRKLSSGKWSCTTDATPDPLTGKRRQVTRRGDTKKEAVNRAQLAADATSKKRQPQKRLVQEVYIEWLNVYKETVKASSVRTREVAMSAFLKKHGNHYIGQMHTSDIQDFLVEQRDRNLSKNFLSSIKASLNLLFAFALKNEYIEKNIVEDTVVPRANESAKGSGTKKKYLEKDEIQLFLTGAKSSGRRNAYSIALTMLSTGLRIGEVLSLTWDDVNLKNKTLEVNTTLFEKAADEGGFELVPPKSDDSYRTVSFNDNLAKVLKKMKVQYNKEKLVGLRDPKSKWHDFVFTGRHNQPVRSTTISSAFNKIYRAYDITDVSGTHVLRHTHITMLVEAGVDLPVIVERVGHADINVTLEIYTHVTNKMQQQSDDKINEYFSQFI